MSNWRMAKGLIKGLVRCDKCGGHYSPEEFSKEEDLCLYCVFPETSRVRPAPMNYEMGFPRNVTKEREMLDNLDNTPEKQSKESVKARKEYRNR